MVGAGERVSRQPLPGFADYRRMFQHVVARTIDGLKPFTDSNLAEWVWKRMRNSFPDAVAAVLMPDHPHLIVERRPNVVQELGALLSGISRHARQRRLWQPIPAPREIPDFRQLQRQIRYVLLNPCRARLAADPLEWPWSTHRGVIGAEIDPWVSAERLVPIFGWPRHRFEERFHRYVSGDPSVTPQGSAFPREVMPSEVPTVPLGAIAAAARAATPWSLRPRRREVFAALAMQQGWRDASAIARACGMSISGARRVMQRAHEDSRIAVPASLCLGDERLRRRE